MKNQQLLGTGLYTLPEAARILRTNTAALRRWVDGYTFNTARGPSQFSPPVLQGERSHASGDRVITFLDLIELLFVSLFRKEGVSMQTIRAAAKAAHVQFETVHPFAVKRFETDGKRIFSTLEADAIEGVAPERVMQELAISQMVIEAAARPFFRQLDYDAEEVLRYWPLGHEQPVVVDPRQAFGKPIDPNSGVPTRALYLMRRKGESTEAIARWYGVKEEAVTAAVEYEMAA